jgi:hypothetical protein
MHALLAERKGIDVARLIITVMLAFHRGRGVWPVLVRLHRGRLSDDAPIRRKRKATLFRSPLASF